MPAVTAVDGLRDLAGADRMAVQAVVDRFLDQRRVELTQLGASEFTRLLRQSLTGGKWIRPVLCCAGWRAGGGTGQLPADVAVVAGSLELFHAFALVHDDIMDDSDTRRGHPTAHREFAVLHAEHAGPDRLGVHCAILLGDLTLGWSYDLLAQAAPARPVLRVLETMRTETLAGQYFDITTTAADVAAALRICRYKTAAYTVARPLQVGALLADAPAHTVTALGEIGMVVGEAFQLRDDLLGVFGDPVMTGKPVLDDLREGKDTVLLALARQRATPEQAHLLDVLVGDPNLDQPQATQVKDVLTATGARDSVEDMITQRCRQASTMLANADLRPDGVKLVRHLINRITHRDR
jgi:geranylgeranyl diphosphate synthase, type I